MQNQWTNISCIAGLTSIFLIAALYPIHFKWVAGVVAILIILTIRNLLGEVSRKTEIIMTTSGLCCTLITIFFLFT